MPHRLSAPLLLVALASCSTSDDNPGDPSPFVPGWGFEESALGAWQAPPDPLVLAPVTLVAGEQTSLSLSGGEPNEVAYSFWSIGGAGSGPCLGALGGACLGVTAPGGLFGSVDLDGNGDGEQTFQVPGAIGTTVCFQAAVIRGSSGIHSLLSEVRCATITLQDTDPPADTGSSGAPLGADYSVNATGDTLLDVHGAGAQRSDPKSGDAADYAGGHGPQGDVVRIDNYVRCVRGTSTALPDTGQTACYDLGSAGEITCPGLGESLYGQDGHYQGAGPEYEVDNDVVTDLVSGLMWTRASSQVSWDDQADAADALASRG